MSDIKLFRIGTGTVVELTGTTDTIEKSVQTLFEKKLKPFPIYPRQPDVLRLLRHVFKGTNRNSFTAANSASIRSLRRAGGLRRLTSSLLRQAQIAEWAEIVSALYFSQAIELLVLFCDRASAALTPALTIFLEQWLARVTAARTARPPPAFV